MDGRYLGAVNDRLAVPAKLASILLLHGWILPQLAIILLQREFILP